MRRDDPLPGRGRQPGLQNRGGTGPLLARARTALAEAAAEHGLAITATGTAVLGDVGCAPLTSGARYRRIAEEFGALRDAHAVCGCHVHVGVPTVAAALDAGNLLRRRLPALLALTANSPFLRGRDTGHASWRAVTWSRLPSAGPPPRFARPGDYDRAVAELAEAGAILDRRMVYWDVRPSPHLPTVEIRPCDVAATAEEALLAALVVRGLVAAGAEGRGAARSRTTGCSAWPCGAPPGTGWRGPCWTRSPAPRCRPGPRSRRCWPRPNQGWPLPATGPAPQRCTAGSPRSARAPAASGPPTLAAAACPTWSTCSSGRPGTAWPPRRGDPHRGAAPGGPARARGRLPGRARGPPR
ncbi:glutamate-cysteine ligase family protein [Nocardiopsis composta]